MAGSRALCGLGWQHVETPPKLDLAFLLVKPGQRGRPLALRFHCKPAKTTTVCQNKSVLISPKAKLVGLLVEDKDLESPRDFSITKLLSHKLGHLP